jgi:ribonuclease D
VNNTLPDKPDFLYITETDAARASLSELERNTIIGLDTETYWEPQLNHSRVSLVQIYSPAKPALVLDLQSIDLEVLRPIVESPDIMMVAHNARFDEGMLLSAGLNPVAFVDTLRLARSTLRLPSYSLASVTAHLFGIEMDKSFQKSNWRRRPLTRAQLEYAAMDAVVVLHLYDELARLLTEEGRFEIALRSACLTPSSGETRPPRKRRPPQPPPRPLTTEERLAVTKLKKWRLERAFTERVAAYMICADRTLEELVIAQPTTLESLEAIHGLGASRIARFGAELLDALRQALND